MEFDEVYGELLPVRTAVFELDRIELGAQPALHLFYPDPDWQQRGAGRPAAGGPGRPRTHRAPKEGTRHG